MLIVASITHHAMLFRLESHGSLVGWHHRGGSVASMVSRAPELPPLGGSECPAASPHNVSSYKKAVLLGQLLLSRVLGREMDVVLQLGHPHTRSSEKASHTAEKTCDFSLNDVRYVLFGYDLYSLVNQS